jgi:hypothetical protein
MSDVFVATVRVAGVSVVVPEEDVVVVVPIRLRVTPLSVSVTVLLALV